jgi:hypothetical protein
MTGSAAVLVWELAGRPAPIASIAKLLSGPGLCVMCGRHDPSTAPASRALGSNFTDHDLYTRGDADRVCPACLWCCSGKPPASMRMWTVVAAPGLVLPQSHEKAFVTGAGLCLTNRADPGPVIGMLSRPPPGEWVVSVATSGQKHVVPYARVNRGRGVWTVRLENTNVTSDPDEWSTVLTHAASLRAAGHHPDAVLTGDPSMAAIRTAGDLAWWRSHAGPLARYRHAPLLTLALWCLTKGTIPDHAALRSDSEPDNAPEPAAGPGGPAGVDGAVPGQPAQLRLY